MKRLITWSMVLGFAAGGFFDGIVLHQILQWHHLLSLVPGLQDLRLQVLWDGYFHALMYAIAVLGLWGLWRTRREGGGLPLLGGLLVGFGLWHATDAVVSHWLLGIHRIRLDSDRPLLWDLGWLMAFGFLPSLAGWLLLRRRDGRSQRLQPPVVMLLAVLTAGAGAWALRPPPGQPFTTVVFAPGSSPQAVFAAVAEADAQLVWTDAGMGVVVVKVAPRRRWDFYRRGAWLVSGAGTPAGCADWSRA